MSLPVLSARGLSKRYQLGSIGRHTLADEVTHAWHKLRGRDPRAHMGRMGSHTATGEFWALRDVGFDVHAGEVVGVIGRNGAGKSTLLKILSRITEPSSGSAELRGRVGSLLEVGTGFHPDLTGRENVLMNGALLGMKKAEVLKRFDEIITFAEISDFIDTPVKRYSSGMYVRLAFAVAAHLEPEILIVDEVLAVGDLAFQRKCLGKMGEVASTGRTVLFVSHNLSAVRQLCPRCLWLEGGRLAADGDSEEVLRAYAGRGAGELHDAWRGEDRAFASLRVSPSTAGRVPAGQPLEFEFRLSNPAAQNGHMLTAQIQREDGQVLHHASDLYLNENENRWRRGHRRWDLPPHALAPGVYTLSCWLWNDEKHLVDHIDDALRWEVTDEGQGFSWHPPAQWKGLTGPGFGRWELQEASL